MGKNYQRDKRDVNVCDNCAYFSLNSEDTDRNDLRAWCDKSDRPTNFWDTCKKFKMVSD